MMMSHSYVTCFNKFSRRDERRLELRERKSFIFPFARKYKRAQVKREKFMQIEDFFFHDKKKELEEKCMQECCVRCLSLIEERAVKSLGLGNECLTCHGQ